jgi:hypothetical protein
MKYSAAKVFRISILRRGLFFFNTQAFQYPYYWLLFLYFVTVSGDLLNLPLLMFRVKMNNVLAMGLFSIFVLIFRKLKINLPFFLSATACFASLIVSAILGYNPVACFGFAALFAFSYCFYFVVPYSAVIFDQNNMFFRLYFASFIWVGLFATAQVFGSLLGWTLPFVGQTILQIARGQGFSYEPSYYALYMTPFTFFHNTKYLLQNKEERNKKLMLLANFLLLISTSTGCFFSYLSFIGLLFLFKWLKLIENGFIFRAVYRIGIFMFGVFFLGSLIFPELVYTGFLKFFYFGFKHHSFQERWTMIVEYWNVFLKHPWFGTGLGGATAYLLEEKGMGPVDYSDPNLLKAPELVATNVTTELLAGVGLIGMASFFSFFFLLWNTFKKTFKMVSLKREERIDLVALAMSICVMLFTLQFNQSILRAYVWLHVGCCMGFAKKLQRQAQNGFLSKNR